MAATRKKHIEFERDTTLNVWVVVKGAPLVRGQPIRAKFQSGLERRVAKALGWTRDRFVLVLASDASDVCLAVREAKNFRKQLEAITKKAVKERNKKIAALWKLGLSETDISALIDMPKSTVTKSLESLERGKAKKAKGLKSWSSGLLFPYDDT